MPWVLPDNEIDINARITKDNVWRDVDLGTNNDVPAGTKAVIIHMRNTHAINSYVGAVRPNGSSLSPTAASYSALTFIYLFVKLDANRLFEAKVNNAAMDLRVVAYTSDDLGINPYVDKTPGVAGSYQDVDVSDAGVPAGAAAALFYLDAGGNNRQWAIRKDGTTFDSYYYKDGWTQGLAFGALSAARLAEIKAQDVANNKFWVQGYIPSSQCLMADTPTEKSPGTAGSWQDVDCSAIIPAGALAAILLIRNTSAANWIACVRKKGSADDFSASNKCTQTRQYHAVVGLDGSRIFQAYVEHATEVDIFVLGYIGTPPAQTVSGAGNIATGEAVGSPGVLPGSVTLQPVALGSGEAWGTPAVLPGSVSVLADGIVSAEAFGVAAVLPGAVSLQPSGIASEEAGGLPLITPGAVTLQLPGILSEESFGLSLVLPGEVAIRPTGILSAEAFGLPFAVRIPKYLETTLTVSRLEVKVDG
jgi:hypothetical protein